MSSLLARREVRSLLLQLSRSDMPSAEDGHHSGLLNVPNVSINGPTSSGPKIRRSQSRAFLSEDGMPQPIEYFVASDASAVIEHTKRVLYLEDDDIAHIAEGGMYSCDRMSHLIFHFQSCIFTVFAETTDSLPCAPSST